MPTSETELLIKILDLVDKGKRRDAYVTERFFEERVLPCLVSGEYSTGWCYVTRKINGTEWRYWFKVMPPFGYEDWDTEKVIVKEIAASLLEKNRSQKVYIVYISNKSSNEDAPKARYLADNLEIMSLEKKNDEEWSLKNSSCPDFVDMNKMRSEIKNLLSIKSSGDGFCSEWMRGCGYTYLTKLLLQRLLMNYGLDQQWPVDVDAMEIDGDGKLVIHEFKRKTPCPGGYYPFDKKVSNIGTLSAINSIRKKIMKKSCCKSFESAAEKLGYKKTPDLCYGLDMSHLRNFEYCCRHGIGYRYTIWDSSDYPDKPDIKELFDINKNGRLLRPKRGVNLLSQKLDHQYFVGFTSTHGQDSGTFSNRLRLQATIRQDTFKRISWPCEQR